MAEKKRKWKDNLPGAYYVDEQCIACDACVNEAPGFFKMNDLVGHALVYRQPKSSLEILKCENAKAICPVAAIGSDGED